ncbi:hypothetical protein EB796_006206 [Bugula neritina]|uniref:Uncharacterized protein n=1 Tax=Bugula neritina TaxID=10212 RepID=A0A7J7KCZ7_BUGNE|nr:hypothetical protein EB796_006206 [Bugula neritina]
MLNFNNFKFSIDPQKSLLSDSRFPHIVEVDQKQVYVVWVKVDQRQVYVVWVKVDQRQSSVVWVAVDQRQSSVVWADGHIYALLLLVTKAAQHKIRLWGDLGRTTGSRSGSCDTQRIFDSPFDHLE